jgi:hypothetical protein
VIDEHAAAVLALLNGVGKPAAIRIDDGKTPDPLPELSTHPYALASFDSDDPEFDKEANAWLFVMTVTVHCVGANAQAARQVADWVRTALVAVRPTVSGRSCFPTTSEPGIPPQRNETTGSTVMDLVAQYTIRSIPG